jgi:hypothetical protein
MGDNDGTPGADARIVHMDETKHERLSVRPQTSRVIRVG